jgi:adenine-specific DNA glycosylase
VEKCKDERRRRMSVYDWEDVGGDMADHEAMLEEASEICEERDGNCFGCPIARECSF